tara:strand:- start:566 stop:1132 length:567 start_codon:yes stop_codon:yes gene_type:complete
MESYSNLSEKPQYPEIAAELLDMEAADQNMRKEAREDGYWNITIDIENQDKLKAIISKVGWPTRSKVGAAASSAAWLIAQHSDFDPDFQNDCLELIKSEKNEDISKKQIAYLSDRIRVNSNQPQLYCTQFDTNKDGTISLSEFEGTFEEVDNRRRKVGMESIKDYLLSIHIVETNPRLDKSLVEYIES